MKIGIDPAIGSDQTAIALMDGHTGLILHVLQEGDGWGPHPAGGVIITNRARPPLWVRVVDGKVVSEEMHP